VRHSEMGNLCGCVRTDKEEKSLDPGRAPLRPPKRYPGRKFLMRSSQRKWEEKPPESSKKKSGKEESKRKNSTEGAKYSREVSLDKSIAQKFLTERTDLFVSNKVAADLLKTETVSNSCTRDDAYKRTVGKAEVKGKTLLKEIGVNPEKKEGEYFCEQILRQLAFQKNRELPHLKKEPKSSKDPGDDALNKDHFRTVGDTSKWKNKYNLHLLECHAQECSQQVYPYSEALPFSVENAASTILHNRSKISDIHVTGESEDMSAKERLLLWTQQITEGCAGVRCENFTTCWRDGKLFNAIIHKYRYLHFC
ncbi:hypothetical protein E2320_019715, partial [Naja naja]